jgi:hypothetical protein
MGVACLTGRDAACKVGLRTGTVPHPSSAGRSLVHGGGRP